MFGFFLLRSGLFEMALSSQLMSGVLLSRSHGMCWARVK